MCFAECVLHGICKFIHCLYLWRPLLRFKAHARVLACVDEEQCVLCGGVNMVVVCELCHGQPVILIILSFTHKDSQILLQLLVDALSLTISLGVVCCGCCNFDIEEAIEFAHELGNKLRSTIGYN